MVRTITAVMTIAPSRCNDHIFASWSPVKNTIPKPIPQNHESPECALKAAKLRNKPEFSLMRNWDDRRLSISSNVRMSKVKYHLLFSRKVYAPIVECANLGWRGQKHN